MGVQAGGFLGVSGRVLTEEGICMQACACICLSVPMPVDVYVGLCAHTCMCTCVCTYERRRLF